MHAALLYQLTGDPHPDTISSRLDNGFPAIDAGATQYLDGRTLYHGDAAARIDDEVQKPVVTSDGIHTEADTVTRRVHTEWYADLDDGWLGLSSSAGEFLHDYFIAEHGVTPDPLDVDLIAWGDHFLDQDTAYCWGLSYSEGDDEDAIRAGAGFHDDASLEQLEANLEDVSQVGFRYDWGGEPVRGVVCASGYVAVYRDWIPAEYARWLADELLPYTVHDPGAGSQATLEAGAECDRCGRETDVNDAGYCIVCQDKLDEEGVADD